MLKLVVRILRIVAASAEALTILARMNIQDNGDRGKITTWLAGLKGKSFTSTPEAAQFIVTLAHEAPKVWDDFVKGEGGPFLKLAEDRLENILPELILDDEEPEDEGPAGWDEDKPYASQKPTQKGAIRKFVELIAVNTWGAASAEANRSARRILDQLRKNGEHTDRPHLRELIKQDHAAKTGATATTETPATAPAKSPAPSSWERKKFKDLDEAQRREFRHDLREIAERLVPDDFKNAARAYYDDAERKNWTLSRHGVEKQFTRSEEYPAACESLKKLLKDKFDGRRLDNPSFQHMANKIADGTSLEEVEDLIDTGFCDWEEPNSH